MLASESGQSDEVDLETYYTCISGEVETPGQCFI